MPTQYQMTKYINRENQNKVYQVAGIPFRNTKKNLPAVALKQDSIWWDLLFVALSIGVGLLTEGLGTIVFAELMAFGALSEATALIVAGVVQTTFEVVGQVGINVLAGRTSTTAMITSVLPGLGIFGLGKVFKGVKLLKNEKALFQTLISNNINRETAKEISKFMTKDFLVGKDIGESLFLHAIQNPDAESVSLIRGFRDKIYRSSGVGVKKKLSEYYKNQSAKYGHTVVDDIPSLIDTRLAGAYNNRWTEKALQQKLRKWFGHEWLNNFNKTQYIEDLRKGLDKFKGVQILKKDNIFNRTINKPRNLFKLKRKSYDTPEVVGLQTSFYNDQLGEWTTRKFLYDKTGNFKSNQAKFHLNKAEFIDKIYKQKKTLLPRLVREEGRLVDTAFRTLRNVTNPLKLIKPSNAINYGTRKISQQVEKMARKNEWFTRITEQIRKTTKHLSKFDSQLIRRFNLIPAINSEWQIGFRIINMQTFFVEVFYRNKARGTIVTVQRQLTPLQFERMLVAYETGQAGEFYNRELALGWGLKREWVKDSILSSAVHLRMQSYIYSGYYAKRNIKSFFNGIQAWSNGNYKGYPVGKKIKDYSIIRAIRTSGSLLGLGWLSASAGVQLYTGNKNPVRTSRKRKGLRLSDQPKTFSLGKAISSSLGRRTRMSIKRWKSKPYYNYRKKR